jgi:uncharacterized SAM-binding protein YcdF (DUF218 family)
VPDGNRQVPESDYKDAQTVWDYHHMHHELKACDAAIGLGSHDLGVATFAAELYQRGLFGILVFSGANSPTTAARFPHGEAYHYREHAIDLGVPEAVILVEPHARNTGENINLSRSVFAQADVKPDSLMLISKPYMERRAYATCRQVWPEAEVVCASEPLTFEDYVASIGDIKLVIDMLVGDLQRVIEYPRLGFAIEQDVPDNVCKAYDRLLRAGYDSRLLR